MGLLIFLPLLLLTPLFSRSLCFGPLHASFLRIPNDQSLVPNYCTFGGRGIAIFVHELQLGNTTSVKSASVLFITIF